MELYNGKPLLCAMISCDEEGIEKISLVSEPAVMVDFVTLAKQEEIKMYAIQNEEQQVVYGVVMVADTPIYRRSATMGEYYIKYTKDVIKQMAEKFIKDGNANNINLEHLEGTDMEGVHMVELFIKDAKNGINPSGFESVPDGSLFAKYKVHSPMLWNAIKNGEFKGFSLEGYFSYEEVEMSKEDTELQLWSDILDMLKQIENKRYLR